MRVANLRSDRRVAGPTIDQAIESLPIGSSGSARCSPKRLISVLSFCCALGLGLGPLLKPKPVWSAEQISVTYGPLELPITIEALETFAETGEITGGLRLYARFLNDAALAEFQRFLQRRFEVDPFLLSQLTYSSLGEDVVRRLGNVIRTDSNLNGLYALRSAMILAAADPQGISVLGVLQNYPSYRIRISAQQLLNLRREFTKQIDYRDAAVTAIAQVASQEAAEAPPLDPQIPPLGEPGPYSATRRTLMLERDRQTLLGETIERQFRVLLYLPNDLAQPAPVVVISHGLGSSPEAFAYLGEHLATHGFVAVLPQHIGSDEARRVGVLEGVFSDVVTPVEFIDRPFDISYMLNELEHLAASDPSYSNRMNLDQVGVIGHSFGGYTALALAGADLNTQDYLRQECNSLQARLDVSFVLQCTATALPPFTFPLQDERVQAAIAVSPLTSLVFGPDGMSGIQVPTMIVSGSNDFIAASVQEQIHPFLWLNTPDKYLALLIPSSHTFSDDTPPSSDVFQAFGELLSGPDPELGQTYIRNLSTAFMQRHLNQQLAYDTALTATYAQSIEQDPLELELIRSLTPDQLQQAFGGPPPIPFFPEMTAAPDDAIDQPGAVLPTIAETGVLRAAIRTDSPPFGFVDATGQPAGFCVNLLTGLTEQLQQQLDTPVRLEIVPSTLENRFAMVQNGTVQVECGPNSLQEEKRGVRFSTPFFLTGTQFLVRTSESDRVNPLGSLAGVRIGVLEDTTTEAFVQQRYPNAEIVELDEANSITSGVQALVDGAIDAFANDGILLLSAAQQANLSTADYTLLPTGPLTCEPYGLILPEGDRQWRETVNDLMVGRVTENLRQQEFASFSSYLFLTLDYCVE
jgi:predicted dienelactone hydrolase